MGLLPELQGEEIDKPNEEDDGNSFFHYALHTFVWDVMSSHVQGYDLSVSKTWTENLFFNAFKPSSLGPIYNPLNIPLGWDGKPIPYWLYKLHGLGVEYKCEICGNQSYWGRRAFDRCVDETIDRDFVTFITVSSSTLEWCTLFNRHFQEWKHAHGMRCLGVPNTKHFHDITLIEDVLTLYAKIKDQLTTGNTEHRTNYLECFI
jgi:hypothetical protein